jgi:hypothetical protein
MKAMDQLPSKLKRIPDLPKVEFPTRDDESTDTGLKEAKLLGSDLDEDQIRKKAANAEHNRSENFKNHFERIALAGLWAFAVIGLLLGFAWFWHLFMPFKWHWLSSDQVTQVQNFLTGGVVAAVATGHFKKRLE